MNLRNPFLWIIVTVVLALLGVKIVSPDMVWPPISAVGFIVLGLVLGFAHREYDKGGMVGVKKSFRLLYDRLTGRW